jgi:hypothetical protein
VNPDLIFTSILNQGPWLGQFFCGRVDPLIPFLDKHDRDVLTDGVLATAVGFQANQPVAILDKFQAAWVVAWFASLATDAIRTTEYFQQILAYGH